MKSDKHRRFILLTHPRSGSNLLIRILSLTERPDVEFRNYGGYFFAGPFFLHGGLKIMEKSVDDWTNDEKTQMKQAYLTAIEQIEEHVGKAESNDKLVLFKEHCDWLVEPSTRGTFTFGKPIAEPPWMVQLPTNLIQTTTRSQLNQTVIPDEYLRLWRPTFLIRHPALAYPSDYRAFLDTRGADAAASEQQYFELHMTLRWTRTLYDWYTKNLTPEEARTNDPDVTWPILLDSDDVMTNPDIVTRLSGILGLDPAHLRFKWAAATPEEMAKYPSDGIRRMVSTITASEGIVPGKTAVGLDLDVEVPKWKGEFGEREGLRLERWVRGAMPDYEYLTSKRLKMVSR